MDEGPVEEEPGGDPPLPCPTGSLPGNGGPGEKGALPFPVRGHLRIVATKCDKLANPATTWILVTILSQQPSLLTPPPPELQMQFSPDHPPPPLPLAGGEAIHHKPLPGPVAPAAHRSVRKNAPTPARSAAQGPWSAAQGTGGGGKQDWQRLKIQSPPSFAPPIKKSKKKTDHPHFVDKTNSPAPEFWSPN